MTTSAERVEQSLNRLCKWRSVLTGRILGTQPITDPPAQGYRDLFEKNLILRAEVSALTNLLITAGAFTQEQLQNAIANEADFLSEAYEKTFPGMKATDVGIEFDRRAVETMKGWPE